MDHGVVSRRELLAAGLSDADIRSAVQRDRLTRLRPGWFARSGAAPDVARAVAMGGALTCVSALRRYRVWVPQSAPGLHVRLTAHARRQPTPVVSCGVGVAAPSCAVDDVPTAVMAAAGCVRGESLTAVFDSVLNRRLMGPGELAELLRDQPRRVHRALAACDAAAESGTETAVRLYLRRRQWAYRSQVVIPTVGRVDLLVGESLVIECDSNAHHGGERIDRDRHRDLALHLLGYFPFRVSHAQVFGDFGRVAAAIDALVQRNEHRRPVRSAENYS